ncbi:MAG: hypothetical protein Q8P67_04280 [archaeon]|nr:hypothetical protein [archaeon]
MRFSKRAGSEEESGTATRRANGAGGREAKAVRMDARESATSTSSSRSPLFFCSVPFSGQAGPIKKQSNPLAALAPAHRPVTALAINGPLSDFDAVTRACNGFELLEADIFFFPQSSIL